MNFKIDTQKKKLIKRSHQYIIVKNIDKKWHTYGVRWTEDAITWYCDGKPYSEYKNPSGSSAKIKYILNLLMKKNCDGSSAAMSPSAETPTKRARIETSLRKALFDLDL